MRVLNLFARSVINRILVERLHVVIMTVWSAKNPYSSRITENYILNGEGSRKETRHIVFDLGDSGLEYKVGDALAVLPENPQEIVDNLIANQGWNPLQMVDAGKGEKTLRDALKRDVEIHRVNKRFVGSLIGKVKSSGLNIDVKLTARRRMIVGGETILEWDVESGNILKGLNSNASGDNPVAKVETLSSDSSAMEDYIWSRDYIDVLDEFAVNYTSEEFLGLADRLKPRLYSIASSLDAHPGLVELTVGIIRYTHHGRDRGGLCTLFMADEIDESDQPVRVFMSPTKTFVLPEDPSVDIIMVGPGTGIAPFRAFMEQRIYDKASGRNWLIFGDQSSKTEFYYQDTIEKWLDEGDLSHFTTAWSRDQEDKIYVQHRMTEHGKEIWKWLSNGAYFYVCGDKQYMAKDVHRTLIEIASEHGSLSKEEATYFIEKVMMREQKRYLRDVY